MAPSFSSDLSFPDQIQLCMRVQIIIVRLGAAGNLDGTSTRASTRAIVVVVVNVGRREVLCLVSS